MMMSWHCCHILLNQWIWFVQACEMQIHEKTVYILWCTIQYKHNPSYLHSVIDKVMLPSKKRSHFLSNSTKSDPFPDYYRLRESGEKRRKEVESIAYLSAIRIIISSLSVCVCLHARFIFPNERKWVPLYSNPSPGFPLHFSICKREKISHCKNVILYYSTVNCTRKKRAHTRSTPANILIL